MYVCDKCVAAGLLVRAATGSMAQRGDGHCPLPLLCVTPALVLSAEPASRAPGQNDNDSARDCPYPLTSRCQLPVCPRGARALSQAAGSIPATGSAASGSDSSVACCWWQRMLLLWVLVLVVVQVNLKQIPSHLGLQLKKQLLGLGITKLGSSCAPPLSL